MRNRERVKRPELSRALGLADAIGIGLGAIVGAGIFVVTGMAAGAAGPALIPALALAGGAAAMNALSSAELAARFPYAGGTYEYGYRVLSPEVGFAAGWLFLTSKMAAAGTVALGLGAYLNALGIGIPSRVVAGAGMVGFTIVNYIGVRRSSIVNLVMLGISAAGLLALVVVGSGAMALENFRPFAPRGIRGVLAASALMFFAYTGYARIATLGEEVREPERTIPRAIVITIVVAILLYGAVATVAIGVAGAERLSSSVPLALAAEIAGGTVLRWTVGLAGVTAMLGVALSQLLGLSRMAFAMARRGDLPAPLAAVHPHFGVPHRAVSVVGAVAIVVATTGTLEGVARTATFAILLYYAIANSAALRLPADAKLFPDFVPIAGLTTCLLLALSLPPRTIVEGILLLAVGFLVRALLHRLQRPAAPLAPDAARQ
jgi:basic amino acid/polyamine antiporter, APA family